MHVIVTKLFLDPRQVIDGEVEELYVVACHDGELSEQKVLSVVPPADRKLVIYGRPYDVDGAKLVTDFDFYVLYIVVRWQDEARLSTQHEVDHAGFFSL